MLKSLHINALQERVQELEPGSEEAKAYYLELARRFRDGIGIPQDLEEAEYWLYMAGEGNLSEPATQPMIEDAPPAGTLGPIDIQSYLRMTPFHRRRAAQAKEPGGMYSYALYLEENNSAKDALALLRELVEMLEQHPEDPDADALLVRAKLALGRLYQDPLCGDPDLNAAKICLEEAAREMGYLDAFPELIKIYERLHMLDEQTVGLLQRLSRVSWNTPGDLLTLAQIYLLLGRKTWAAACFQGVLSQDDASAALIQAAQSALDQLQIQEPALWRLYQAVSRDDCDAIFRFSVVAASLQDHETQLQLLLRYMELEEDCVATDARITAQVCAQLAQLCPNSVLAYTCARKGAALGDQSCRWMLYAICSDPGNGHPDLNEAVQALEAFGDDGTADDKLLVAQQYEKMGNPAVAKIWYQEVLALGEDAPYAVSQAYRRLYDMGGADESGQPITAEYLEQKATQGNRGAMLALTHMLLSQQVPAEQEIRQAQAWLDQLEQIDAEPRWNESLMQCASTIAIAWDRLHQWEKQQEKERLAQEKKQARLEKQRLAREQAKQEKLQQQALEAQRKTQLNEQAAFLAERESLKHARRALRQSDDIVFPEDRKKRIFWGILALIVLSALVLWAVSR